MVGKRETGDQVRERRRRGRGHGGGEDATTEKVVLDKGALEESWGKDECLGPRKILCSPRALGKMGSQ